MIVTDALWEAYSTLTASPPALLALHAVGRSAVVPMARAVKRFAALGYEAVRACAVDLFPRADHVEAVALLKRREDDQGPDN